MWVALYCHDKTVPIGLYDTVEDAHISYISFLSRKKKTFYRALMVKLENEHKTPLVDRTPGEVSMAIYEEDDDIKEDFEAECIEAGFHLELVKVEGGELFDFTPYREWDMQKLYILLRMILAGIKGTI